MGERSQPPGRYAETSAPKRSLTLARLAALVLITGAWIISVWPSASYAAEDCPVSTPQVSLSVKNNSVAVDYSMSAAEIVSTAEAAGISVGQRHPLGMYSSVATYSVALRNGAQQRTDGSVCMLPTEVLVVFSYIHRTIHIAREIRENSCLSRAWIAREMANSRTDDAAVRSFLGAFGDPLRTAISGIQASPAANGQLSKTAFIAAVNAVIQGTLGDLSATRDQWQRELAASPAIGDPDESCRRNPNAKVSARRISRSEAPDEPIPVDSHASPPRPRVLGASVPPPCSVAILRRARLFYPARSDASGAVALHPIAE